MNNFNTVTATSAPRRGFTLIELLIVITIIAILAALLGPALAAAKKHATIATCLSNQKQLTLGWQLYADDNHGLLASTQCKTKKDWRIGAQATGGTPPPWNSLNVPVPSITDPIAKVKWETEEGYREGVLFSYAPNVDVLHCPGDNRWEANEDAWDSYSGMQGLNGEVLGGEKHIIPLTKESQIAHPADRFVFIEEMDSRGDNINSWDFNIGPAPQFNGSFWVDSPAAYHIDSSTFSFGDGHAESHRWLMPDTLFLARSTEDSKGSSSTGTAATPADESNPKFYRKPTPDIVHNVDVTYIAT
ncbi:MAG: prepilin-type N-terminal cleavage/methylation domain-containing protein, partial [Verrucomicrobia bacterium]|nr:prepilin-type N-terminal cleavage/methylation domain-containing protein [Verrucomicrobiota bacterium]